ncbi:RhuM family protein [Wolbachia endosymbiont of Brugia pahangi]|uniref:RhuM family protein n=1 Tax=Wolbachia endosymbiont of Brugia pahangi TaxID=96495 RepID=UPI001435D609|nr:RhuM family protein [Wolbachia endosymbiont of Brugia pahangi]QIT36247.1 virulence RhuM family protein [Wolbachia endosymbiont of Brugia pahangi]
MHKTTGKIVESEILLYTTPDGDIKSTFCTRMRAFSSRKKNSRVVSILEVTASDCKKYPTQFYNLDAILAVGYRVSSQKATAFRVWA